MNMPPAVQQAVALLDGRLSEARSQRDRLIFDASQLTQEIEAIEGALERLNGALVSSPKRRVDSGSVTRAEPLTPTAEPKSIRAAVIDILEAEPRGFTPQEVREWLPPSVVEGKTTDQVGNSVRSALWSLRQRKDAIPADDDSSRTIAAKWFAHVITHQDSVTNQDDGQSTADAAVWIEET